MKHQFILLAALQCTLVYGQKEEMLCLDFKRWTTDAEFNQPKAACYVNDTYVKNFIGFDLKSYPGDFVTKENLEKPLVINGIKYEGKVTLKREQESDFVTLEDVRKLYCPEVKEPVVYMINEYFILNDVASYKLDKNYIEQCVVLHEDDFEIFKDASPFSIIRIYTKTDEKPVRVR